MTFPLQPVVQFHYYTHNSKIMILPLLLQILSFPPFLSPVAFLAINFTLGLSSNIFCLHRLCLLFSSVLHLSVPDPTNTALPSTPVIFPLLFQWPLEIRYLNRHRLKLWGLKYKIWWRISVASWGRDWELWFRSVFKCVPSPSKAATATPTP